MLAAPVEVEGAGGTFVTVPCAGTSQKLLFAEQTSSLWRVDSCAWGRGGVTERINEPALMSEDTTVEQNRNPA